MLSSFHKVLVVHIHIYVYVACFPLIHCRPPSVHSSEMVVWASALYVIITNEV